jgi:hypothetical protein
VAVEVVITKRGIVRGSCLHVVQRIIPLSAAVLPPRCWVLPPRRHQISSPLPFPAPWKDLVEVCSVGIILKIEKCCSFHHDSSCHHSFSPLQAVRRAGSVLAASSIYIYAVSSKCFRFLTLPDFALQVGAIQSLLRPPRVASAPLGFVRSLCQGMPARPVRRFPCGWPGCFCDVIVGYMLRFIRPCIMGVLREGAYQNKPSVLLSTSA